MTLFQESQTQGSFKVRKSLKSVMDGWVDGMSWKGVQKVSFFVVLIDQMSFPFVCLGCFVNCRQYKCRLYGIIAPCWYGYITVLFLLLPTPRNTELLSLLLSLFIVDI